MVGGYAGSFRNKCRSRVMMIMVMKFERYTVMHTFLESNDILVRTVKRVKRRGWMAVGMIVRTGLRLLKLMMGRTREERRVRFVFILVFRIGDVFGVF